MSIERSRPVFRARPNLYWIAACLLCAFVGAAIMNGRANHRVIEAKNASCHWTIQNELKNQERRLTDQ